MSVPCGPWASSFLGPPAATPFPEELGVRFPACRPLLRSCLLSLQTWWLVSKLGVTSPLLVPSALSSSHMVPWAYTLHVG